MGDGGFGIGGAAVVLFICGIIYGGFVIMVEVD